MPPPSFSEGERTPATIAPPDDRRTPIGQTLIVGLGGGLLGATALFFPIGVPISLFDGGLASSGGTFMLHGALPYRDFWWLYGPLAPPVAGAFGAVFGPSILLVRLLGLAMHAVQAGAGFALLRPRLPAWAAAALSIGGTNLAAAIGGLEFTAWALALALALTGLAIRQADRTTLAGIFIGLAFLARFDVGGYALIAALATGPRRGLLAGFVAVSAPVGLLMLATTPLASLVEQVLWFPLVGQRLFRSVPLPEVSGGVGSLLVFAVLVVIPKIALVIAAAQLVRTRFQDRLLVTLTVFATLCQLQTLSRADYFHQAQAALPALLTFGVSWADSFRVGPSGRSVKLRALRRARFALASTVTGLTVVLGASGLGRSEPGLMPLEDRQLIAAIRTVAKNTGAKDPIFVGLGGHRHTLLNDMVVYYLADRRPGVRVAMFNPGVTNTEAVQAEMAQDLERSQTNVAITDDRWTGLAEASNESRHPGSSVLDDYLASAFSPVCQYGPITVLVRPVEGPSITCEPTREETLVQILAGLGSR